MFTGMGILGKGGKVKIWLIGEVYGFSISQYLYIYISVWCLGNVFFQLFCINKIFFLVFNQIKRGENEESRL